MKEFKLAISTPTTGFARTVYTYSLVKLILYYAQTRIHEENEHQTLDFLTTEGSGISSIRESHVVEAKERDFTHILFIDEDMGFWPDTLHIMARRNLPIVGCNYSMRVKGSGFTALKADQSGRVITTEESTGTEQVWYTGFGFCLLDLTIFDKIDRPWFLIAYNLTDNKYSTEDGAFARKVAKAGIPWYVDQDASKQIVHTGFYSYHYTDAVANNKIKKGI